MLTVPRATGALRSPLTGREWPIDLLVPTAVELPLNFHSPYCSAARTVDQNGYGACVPVMVVEMDAGQEFIDEGRWLLPLSQAWEDWYNTWNLGGVRPPAPGTLDWQAFHAEVLAARGVTDLTQGTWATEVLDRARTLGIPTSDGSARRLIAASYLVGVPSAALVGIQQQAIFQVGPIGVVGPWPYSWFSWSDPMPAPAPLPPATAHGWERCGWETLDDGRVRFINHQSWGPFGHDPEYPDHFRTDAAYDDALGMWESWKILDVRGDNQPPAPPPPEGNVVVPVYSNVPALVDLPLDTQLYKEDGVTSLVRVTKGGAGRFSPGFAYATKRWVDISTGGQRQYAVVDAAQCLNVRPLVLPFDATAVKADLADAAAAIDAAAAGLP